MFGIDDAVMVGAGADLLGGALGFLGGEDTNKANMAIVKEQEDFQERMRSTAYQTAVTDLEKAGLNPMLAYSNGPAATPSGNAIAMQNPASSLQQGMSSAGSSLIQNASVDNLKSQSALNNSLMVKAAADTQNALNSAQAAEASAKKSSADAASTLADLPGKQNRAAVESSTFGRGAAYFDRFMEFLGHLNPFVSSASGAKNAFAPAAP